MSMKIMKTKEKDPERGLLVEEEEVESNQRTRLISE